MENTNTVIIALAIELITLILFFQFYGKVKTMNTALETLKNYAAEIDRKTNEIAAVLSDLKTKLTERTENSVSTEEITSALGNSIAQLENLGKPDTLPPVDNGEDESQSVA